MSLDLTNNNPDLAGFDLDSMAGLGAYRDGSGGGIRELAWRMKLLNETQGRINLLNAFIRKYQLTLARLSWELHVDTLPPVKSDDILFVPEIAVTGYTYDKRDATPHEIAALWPDALWSRSKPAYDLDDNTRDYTAEVDGVIVRILRAERQPAPVKVDRFAQCGPLRIKKPIN